VAFPCTCTSTITGAATTTATATITGFDRRSRRVRYPSPASGPPP
jgi:hypothetical protein